jgi:uncharacterized protein (DUF58 family)
MGQLGLGLILLVVGSWLETPQIVLLGLVLALAEGVRQVWVRSGMRGVEYTRRLPRPRGVVGDAIPLDITVWNRKALPLAWLRAADKASPGVVVRERDLIGREAGEALANAWTLAPFERVTRHFHVVAERRGVYALGPARLEIGDLFARQAASATSARVDRWLVRPRTVAVAVGGRDHEWGGERRARRGLVDDPTRYAGVRPYQPGDPLRSIHWRATARLGSPVSRLFEPARHREVVIVVDLQTVDGPGWAIDYDDDAVESLCVVAASLVRRLLVEGAAVGLAATGYAGGTRPLAFVPPGASNDQLGRCLDLLARLGSFPSAPIERVLTMLLRAIRPGAAIVVLGVRDPAPFVPALRRFAASGHPVQLIALGGDGLRVAARARAGGVDARVGRLDGPWRTATTLVVG